MSFLNKKAILKMRELDAQIDRKNLAKRALRNNIERAVEEGRQVAENLRLETERMKAEYDAFVEKCLWTVMKACDCTPEDMTLHTCEDPIPDPERKGFFSTLQLISVSGVSVMWIERIQLSEFEYQFIATPIGDEDETPEPSSGQHEAEADRTDASDSSVGRHSDVPLAVSPGKDDPRRGPGDDDPGDGGGASET